jgi:CheY-like chemotaxis protein/DNA-binding CsgD family transcriptional regulator
MSRVLAVDDDPDVLALLDVILRRGGHETRLASNADEAVTRVREAEFDCVLLDVMMPGRDGWSVLEELKADPDLSTIPVVMVTARGEPQDRLRGGVGGALIHLTKPFSPQALLDAVADALGGDEPEPVRRRSVKRSSLNQLAQLESGRQSEGPRPKIASLSRKPEPSAPKWRSARAGLEKLTPNQRELVVALGKGQTVSQVAAQRDVSRSNIYSSLRRIHRKLGTETVPDLIDLARETGLVG